MEQDLGNMVDVIKFPSLALSIFLGLQRCVRSCVDVVEDDALPVDQSWAFFFFDFRLQFV